MFLYDSKWECPWDGEMTIFDLSLPQYSYDLAPSAPVEKLTSTTSPYVLKESNSLPLSSQLRVPKNFTFMGVRQSTSYL